MIKVVLVINNKRIMNKSSRICKVFNKKQNSSQQKVNDFYENKMKDDKS